LIFCFHDGFLNVIVAVAHWNGMGGINSGRLGGTVDGMGVLIDGINRSNDEMLLLDGCIIPDQ
jgi:hypothetical protein